VGDLLYLVGTVGFFAMMPGTAAASDSDGEPRTGRDQRMTTETVVALAVAIVVGGYLVYTLLRPEKF
jgi:K+-transporting ATPase KdpF subunit